VSAAPDPKPPTRVEKRAKRRQFRVQTAASPEAALAAAYDGLRSAAANAKKRGHHGAALTLVGADPRGEYGALGGDVEGVLKRVTSWLLQAAQECDDMAVP
jgi:hypothetical protein